MITQIHFGDNHHSTVMDKEQSVLLEEANLINNGISYQQTTIGGLIELINHQSREINFLKETIKDYGYVFCARCGDVVCKDNAVWSDKEQDYICEDCKEQEE